MLNLNTKGTGKPLEAATLHTLLDAVACTHWALDNGLTVQVGVTKWSACIGKLVVLVEDYAGFQGRALLDPAFDDAALTFAINAAYAELDTLRQAVQRARSYC